MSLKDLDSCDFAMRCSDMKCSGCPLKRKPISEKKEVDHNESIEAILFIIACIFLLKWLFT